MAKHRLRKKERDRIDAAVEHFRANRHLFENFAQALTAYFQNDPVLAPQIHFLKYRLKDPEKLRQKLVRKAIQGDVVDESNIFDRITDLAGVRIIHLHTEQMREIHAAILRIIEEQRLGLVKEPTANC